MSKTKNPYAKNEKKKLGQRLILVVRENYCNCASRKKFPAGEFFKRTYKNFQIEATQTHFWRVQMNITWPIYAVSKHNYSPKAAQVIKTLGIVRLLR